ARTRDRIGAAQAAGHQHRRRPAHLAGAHAVHDAGRLLVHGTPRPAPAPGQARAAASACAMNISEPFIRRPIATSLLAAAVLLAGAAAYTQLPVAPLPRVDNPTISISASLPGASPETMAAAVATPRSEEHTSELQSPYD